MSALGRLSSVSFLVAVAVMQLYAQVDPEELKGLSFKIGGGLTVPMNPIARYFGVNGNFVAGIGGNFGKRSGVEGEFLWSGLSPSISLVHPVNAPEGNVNLYALTGNYRFHIDSIGDTPVGVYLIGGGGWYYRHTSIDKNYSMPPLTVCQPIYNWWGYSCGSAGYVSATIASHGSSAGGVNGGIGFTIRVRDTGWKFFVESRYHYAWSNLIPTSLVPVTFGFRFD